MFIDVCFPKDNEENFIEIAGKLKTKNLLFVYSGKAKAREMQGSSGCSIIYGTAEKTGAGMQINALGKKIVVFNPEDRSPFTQVHAKEMANSGNLFMFSFLTIRHGNINSLRKLRLVNALCKKYSIKTGVASFALSPYGLVPEKEIYSVSKAIGMKEAKAKSSVLSLYEYLYEGPSAIFL